MTSPLDEQQQVVLRKRHTCFVEGKIVPNEKSAKILSPDSLFHSATRQDTPDYVIANLDRPIFLGGHAPNIFDFPYFFGRNSKLGPSLQWGPMPTGIHQYHPSITVILQERLAANSSIPRILHYKGSFQISCSFS